jgi:hypothetical protein
MSFNLMKSLWQNTKIVTVFVGGVASIVGSLILFAIGFEYLSHNYSPAAALAALVFVLCIVAISWKTYLDWLGER